MTKKIFIVFGVAILSLIASALILAHDTEQPADPLSVVTGCGVTTDAACCIADCLADCQLNYVDCLYNFCGPRPADCNDVPIGPDCESYQNCRSACRAELTTCKGFCQSCTWAAC